MPKHLLSLLKTLGLGHRGERDGQCTGRPNPLAKTYLELTAVKHCLPHVSEHSSSQVASTFYLFLLIFIVNLTQEQRLGPASLWMRDSHKNNKTQHLAFLKPSPSPSPAGHRSALKPRFIYLYMLPHSLFLATGAHDIVAWDMLEQGSGSPCKWWQQLPPGSRVLLTSSSGGL